MAINSADYPPGFAEYVRPLLDARERTLSRMSREEKLICKSILNAFPELGRGPAFEEIVEKTGLSPDEVTERLEHLNGIDMLKYDADNARVIVLYPLSDISCPHRVHIKGKKPLYAM